LAAERKQVASERFQAEQLRARTEEALEAARKRDRQKVSEEADALLAQLREARAELKEARRALRRAERHDDESLGRVRAALDRVGEKVEASSAREAPAPTVYAGEALDERAVTVGQRVYVPR